MKGEGSVAHRQYRTIFNYVQSFLELLSKIKSNLEMME